MSIILDALKKMEREGSAKRPQTNVPPAGKALPARQRMLILSLAAAALALNLLAVVLWFGMRDGPEERGAPERVHLPVEKRPAAAPVSVAEPSAPARLPAVSDSTPVPAAGFNGEGPATVTGSEEPTSLPPLPATPVARETLPAESRPTPPAIVSPAAAPLLPPPAQVIPRREEGTAVEGVNAAEEREYDGSVLTVEELPENLRAGVKDLKITAHVYSDDPAFRRVAVNDTLKREGDVAAGGLVVEEITEDGAVFSYRGHLFKMESR